MLSEKEIILKYGCKHSKEPTSFVKSDILATFDQPIPV